MPIKLPREQVLYFDFETDNPYGPYATLNLIGFALDDEEAKVCKFGKDRELELEFADHLANPRIRKVGFNIVNFDLQVAKAHGYKIDGPIDDLYLMAKTLYPAYPAYSMKMLCFTELQ